MSEFLSTFCFKYLSKFVEIKRSTIDCLLANGYSSSTSLLALNLDLDLNQLPNLSMDQKEVLSEALFILKSIATSKNNTLVTNEEAVKGLISAELGSIGLRQSLDQTNGSSSADKQPVDGGIRSRGIRIKKKNKDEDIYFFY